MQPYARLVLATLALATGCGRIGFDGLDAPGTGGDDAAPADGDSGATVYGDFVDPMAWTSFDTTTVAPGAGGYVGAAFDGRYLYLVPSYIGGFTGLVTRHDTHGELADPTSWSTFDTSTMNPAARGYNGGAFDGRYVYFIPHENPGGYTGLISRYDTQQAFSAPAAWSTFDIKMLAAAAVGFVGARFDGRYLYLMPYVTTMMARYDTQAPFASPSSWSTFDLASVAATVPGFVGGAFDGRYLYFVPFLDTAASGRIMRYDTQASLTAAGSWTTFDTTTVTANAKGFCGAGYDGRYVYLVPFFSAQGVASGLVTRYDTQAVFTSTAAWSTFDVSTIDPQAKGFFGATFDGRHIYLASYPTGKLVRYDTSATFASAGAWRVFDATTVDAKASAFYGAAFDGGAVYFIPHGASTIARFAAKSPPAMPVLPGFFGSFL